MKKRPSPSETRKPLFEELERRILMSADIPALLDPSVATGADAGAQIELIGESDSAADHERHELVFVDTGVEDYELLVDDLRSASPEGRNLEVILLDRESDGIEQITDFLSDYEGLAAIHIVSHGDAGAAQLGSGWLTSDSLDGYASSIASWSDALSDEADLLFYGCDLAGGDSGASLVESLAKLTGADVAASDDLTGSAELGGDWQLEYRAGHVETSVVFSTLPLEWTGTLDTHLWLSTDSNVAAPGADGLPGGWTEGQVMAFSGPTLAHGAATDGDLSIVIDFDSFTLDAADAGALHFVSRDLTVGGVNGTFDLKAGDVLVSFLQDETILAAYTDSGLDEAYEDQDLLVFRPDSFGNYSSGTFHLLLDDIVPDDLKGVTLIEQDSTIGGTDVAAGSFLIIQETSATTSVDLFVPTGVGAGTTTGSVTPFIDLSNLGIDANRLRGIEVIEAATTIGGQPLAAGSILATLNVDDNVSGVASNNLLVDLNDVFVLNLTSTGPGTTAGTATMFLDGSDVGLDDNPSQENPYALALYNYSQLTVDTTSDVSDGDTSSITALLLDKGADGKISLREAIAAANATPNGDVADVIHFNIGTGLQTIAPTSYLGDITDAVILDATTQPGYSGTPLIELDGSSATGATAGFVLRSNDSAIRGFIVHSFPDEGIEIDASTGFGQNNVIADNWIGIDETGTAHGNADYGLMLTVGAANNLIDGNVISGNLNSGIVIRNSGTDDNILVGNLIGVAPDGTTPVANTGHGIEIYDAATGNRIGGTTAAEANVIAYNTGDGIRMEATAGTDNAFIGNEIFGNTGLGIDLGGDGVTSNDLDGTDDDLGANRLQNFPVLTSAVTDGAGTITIAGSVVGTALTDYRIEFFASAAGDGTGHGEAERLLGFTTFTTDATGGAIFSAPLSAVVSGGELITATATVALGGGSYGDTSEFALNIIAAAQPINSVPGPQSVDEDSALVFNAPNGNLISISDADAGTDELAVALAVNDGTLTLSGTTGLTFLSGSNGSAAMTVTGTLNDLNAALDGMTFMPDPEFSGAVTLEMTTHDDTSLTAHYSFDDLTNLGGDVSAGSLNDGVVSGALPVNDPTRGDVLSFDGVDDVVEIPGLMGEPANVTISAWVDMTSGAGPGEVISIGDSFILRADSWTSSGVRASYYDGSSYNDLWSNIEVNGTGWRHVAAVFDDANDTLEIFIDGTSVASVSTTDSISYTTGHTITTIGRHPDPAQTFFKFDGLIDDARVYDRALTAAEIAAAMSAPPRSDSDSVSITVDPVNDEPVLGTNALTITEGGTVILSAANLAATDVDNVDASLTFSVSSVTGGQFELVASPGVAITSFTQAQVTSSAVQFVHDGGEAAPNYDVSVSDASLSDGPTAASVSFTNQNDAPVDLQVTTTTNGGIRLNEDGGNDAYLIADDGAGLLGGLTSVTIEASFSITTPGASITPLLSYADGTNDEELGLILNNDGSIWFMAHSNGTPLQSTTNQYPQLFDGQRHHVGVSWDSSSGAVAFYVDGQQVDTFSGYQTGETITGGGELVFGQDQDSVLGGFRTADVFSGSLYDVRIFSDVRTPAEVALSHDQTLPSTEPGMIANWRFDDLSTGGVVTDAVSGNNLTEQHVFGAGFSASTPALDLRVSEGASDGTLIGSVAAVDPDSGPPFTYTLMDDAGGRFAIHGSNGEIRLVDSSLIDFSSATSHDITIRVADSGGLTYDEVFTIEVIDSGAPSLATNALTISEGSTVVLSNTDLLATDADDIDSALTFTVSSVTGGQFELVASPGVAITSFTQAQVTSGAVQFVHDGGEAAPSYDVSVSDGSLADGPSAASISFTNQNDAPVLGTNALTINEGGTVILSAANLAATDVDNADASLTFTVSSVTGGQFELVASPGVAITSFTQAQVTAGDVQFVHDGGEAAPAYDVSVSDGSLSDGPSAASISFTNQNDAPVLGTNALTISEAGTVVLSAANLAATDVDTADASLSFSVSSVTGGQFELVASPGVAITSFTQAQVTSGAVQFVHDGGEAAPTYDVSVSDGSLADGPCAASISFTNQNDAPVLGTNALTISEAGTVVLSAANLAATDVDNADASLTFSVSSVTGGQFELVASPGVAITSFTQAQVTSGAVQFVHDGGEAAPTYDVSVSDGSLADGPSAASISFTGQNDAPVLGTNALTITEGGTVILSAANLAATDVDNVDASLTFSVSSVTGGQFELVASPGVAVTSFSQAQVTSGAVQFVHDGGEAAPSYDVSVSDGSLADGPSAASISFTNQNDAPVLGTNALTINEGGTVILSAANLAASDVDNADASLTFTVSSVTGGQFELVASPGVAVTSFSQAQVTSGAVQFVHDGGEAAPSYDVSVSDGSLADGPSAASISFTGQNDAPVLGTNALTITEGGTVILSAANLAATDVDNADASLTFTVSSVTGGQFELVASPGVAITSFTQAQVTAGDVQFVHDGGEAAPAYDVSVSDGSLSDGPSAASISFTNQNDAPVLGTNALTISEAGTVVLSAANLAATDVDNADASLSFSVSSVTGGQFELVASPGVAITSFTQAQVTSGAVQFVHDGGEAAPTYDVSVSDGSLSDGPSAASISFTNQNDAPVLGTNALTISEAGTVVLSAANLAATDVDNADASLTFSVSSVTGGQFELVASPGVAITSFTQAQVTSGAVQFVHDGGEAAPTYDVSVSDGSLADGPSAASISFTNQNDAPVLGTNALTITEGGTVILSAANLAATDVDNVDASLTFSVSSVTGGQFELVASPGVAVTSFSQAQVTSGAVQFVHDGGEAAPSYDVSVSDGSLADGPSAASISFTNQNDAPVLGTNALTINEGGTVILSAANLAASDVDNADASLTFTVSSVTGGQFELVASPGVAVTSFSQAQVTSGAVQFVHDDGEAAPSYDVSVSDGSLSDGPSAASISFTNQNDAPVLGTNALTINEGGTVILSAANLAATDVDNADASLTFTVSSVTGGQFELVASPGVAITSFTQAQVTAGDVQFVHDGGEAAPAYDVSVSDGSLSDGPSAASISFTNQNDAPVLGTNALTISEAGTVVLSAANLAATDVDTADASLSFSVSSVTGGQFELVASPGVAITSFTQAQVTSGAVQFVHDGGEAAPTYDVSVSDGSLSDGPSAASISFTGQNDAPVLGTNALTISEAGTVVLSAANLAATDVDNADASLTFSVSSVTGGQFELVASPGVAITSFTQAQVTSGAVQFVHDGGEAAPSYDVSVSDGSLADGPSAASISFTGQNDAPVLGTNALTITEGGTVILSAANLAATDVDNVDASLTFSVSSVTGGQFELVASPGVAVTSFSQAQVTSGAVQFVHDGGEAAPTYDVSVSDGSLADGPSAASISFTNQNDAPVLGTNALTINEGGTVILSAANLAASDVDNADASLTFTVSSVTGGQFELVASPGVAVTSFSQAQVTSGAVQFVHDGGEAAPSYDVSVSDGSLADGPSAASISFTGQNDAPVLGTNALTITEGGTVILSAANLAATDVDNADASLTFTVSSVTGGQFELVASPGVAITSFTQAQVTAGDVQFVHDGGEAAPAYDVSVSDGSLSDGPSAASISFTNQNDAPVLGTNALTISEAGTVVLSAANLAATDVDTADASLSFSVSSVTGGQFELVASPGVAITSFTQAQVTSGAVQFVHDGGEAAPTYDVSVSDGSLADGPSAASISFTGQNDAPVLGTNALTISEAGTVVLSAANLAATDVDNADASLTFSVSSVTGGQFELVASPGVAITSFTQAQVTSGAVQFVHDGGEAAPSYDVSVSDGSLADGPSAASISFTGQNDAPVLGTNALTITEGGTVILSAANLAATDVDNVDASLTFSVSSVTGGQFELVASPGVAVTSFSQAQVTSGAVQFVHDGGEAAPSYDVSVSDGSLADGPSAASISFTNQNDAPVLGTNALTINEGGTVILSAANLAASDVDNADASLTFTVSSVTGGQFELVASPGVAVTSFSQAQVTSGAVQFVHDGGEAAPSYDVSVSDGSLADGPSAASISFTGQNDAPVLGTNALTITEGGTVILSAANLAATDVDNADASLTFTVSSVTGGQFELVASPGVAITSFTQAQVTSGAVQFVHDGGEAAPAYDVSVSDGSLSDGPSAASISFTNQNDAPVLGTNALTISEAGTVVLSAANLAATDVDTADASLSFSVSSVTGGQFELVASPGVAITSFTQAQVTSGAVQFVHDGGEAAPTYDVSVSDGSLADGPSAASISFTGQNDAPVLGTNALTISEAGTVVLSAANLAATDVDNADASLTFSVSSVTGGQFELVASPGVAITSFTQAQVTSGAVQFVHDGGEAAPTYDVSVSDGSLADGPSAASISFTNQNDAPVLAANSLSIGQGSSVVLSSANLSATDVDDPDAGLFFSISNLSAGQFELVATPGVAVNSFSQAQVSAGALQFVHDGSASAPVYDVTVSDGLLSDTGAASTELTASVLSDPGLPRVEDDPDTETEQEPPPSSEGSSADDTDDADLVLLALEQLDRLRESGMVVAELGHLVQLDGGDLVSASDADVHAADQGPRGEYDGRSRELQVRAWTPEIASAHLMAALDQMGHEMMATPDARLSQQETFISTIEGMTIVASAGVVAGILRSGSLLAVAASSLPLWKGVDPLAVLDISEEERKRRAQELAAAQEDEDEHAVGQLLDRA